MFQHVDDIAPLGFFSGDKLDDVVTSGGGGDSWLKVNYKLLAFLGWFKLEYMRTSCMR